MAWPLVLLEALLGRWPRAERQTPLRSSTDPRGCCPRCGGDVRLLLEHGALHESVCPRCQGRFLPAEATERLVIGELGVERETLLELALHAEVPRVTCPGCTAALWSVRLRGQPVSLCRSCGGLWCDAGELLALSGGRYEEVAGGVATPLLTDDGGVRDVDTKGMCVLQLEPTAADERALIAAFAEVPRFTRADATRAARLACGLLAEGVSVPEGHQLVAALARLGVACRMVPTATLTLPREREIIRVELEEASLVLRDQYGARRELPWGDIDVAALARVMLEPATRAPAKPAARRRAIRGFGRVSLPAPHSTGPPVRADAVEDLVLDLVLLGGAERLRLRALSVGLPPSARVGDRRSSFVALAKQILARVRPAALPSRTAAFLEGHVVPRYDNLLHFERDLAWLRWRHLQDMQGAKAAEAAGVADA